MKLLMLGFRGAMLLGWYKFAYKTNVYRVFTCFFPNVMNAVVIRDFVIAKKKGKW